MLIKSTRLSILIAFISLAASYGIRVASPSILSVERVAAIVSINLQQQLNEVDKEAKQILNDSGKWTNVSHSFFLIDSTGLLRWNQNDFIPDFTLLQDTSKVQWIQTQRGDFVLKKISAGVNRFLIGSIPLIDRYKISNHFLEPRWNSIVFPASNIQIIDPIFLESYPVTLSDGKVIFRIHPTSSIPFAESGNQIALLFWWVGIISLLVSLFLWSYSFYHERKSELSFFLLAIGLITIRLICIYFTIPGFYNSYPLFDPRFFASSSFNASIGDLLLNTCVISLLCIHLFFTYSKWKSVHKLYHLSGLRKQIATGVCIVISFFAFLFPFLYFETIFHNSSISLDITQSIQFDRIRVVAFVCVAISFIATFCFVHIFFRLFLSLSNHKWNSFFSFLILGSLTLVMYSFAAGRNYWITILCGISYFILLYFFGLARTLKTISYRSFFYFLLIIFFFAIQGSLSIKRFSHEERVISQYRFANEFLVGRDFFGEFLLSETVLKIKDDPFIQSSLANPFLSKASIRQKVRQVHLNNYFDRYDIKIYLYNATGEPLDSEPFLDFASNVQTYQTKSSTTGYKGIYFTNDPQGQSERKYLVIVPVDRSQAPAGFIVIELSMKKVIPRNVYPELLVDNRFIIYMRSREYSYGIYTKDELVSSFGEFNYERNLKPSQLANQALYTGGLVTGEFSHIAVEDEGQRIVIVSSPAYPYFNIIINLSFWIVTGLMFVLIGLIIQGFYYWIKGQRVNYSLRVQLYFYSSLLLPLLVVSITTLSITTHSAAVQLNSQYIDKSKLLGESLTADLILRNENMEVQGDDELKKKIRDLARVSDVDATVYDQSGKLIGSSQPLIFDYQFKSEWIDREALQNIVDEKENSFVKEDHMGSLKYFSAFCAIRSPQSGALLGIVSLPFFGSAASLEKTQIAIFGNILSVFTAVLLLFSIFSLLAADRLTHPLRIIARSLSRTTLTGHNELLAWNSTDEIGVMVKEYNRMVQNLEQSKIELARTQKESAWREMAKQVAHEIKNPLTPMKLTLQQMEQLLKSNEGIPKDRAERSVKTLLSQVEILNEIASSFSTFARMPSPVMVQLELNSVLKKTIDLYATTSEKLIWIPSTIPVFVMGDEQLLIRIFSNLILNAFQAGETMKPLVVTVQLKTSETSALITIEDNGQGISEELKSKIFMPYFTTKKSGSGLGLAIVQQGIEQSRGSIWLESQEGKGTLFYVQFPLADKYDR